VRHLGAGMLDELSMTMAERLLELADELASRTPGFYLVNGPGRGNQSTNGFMTELRRIAAAEFGFDYSEQPICGPNRLAVDYYFQPEATIVEVALGLRNPNTEFEKDMLKAVMSQEQGHKVQRLFFISKPGGAKKCSQPGRVEFRLWLKTAHGIEVEVHDLCARQA